VSPVQAFKTLFDKLLEESLLKLRLLHDGNASSIVLVCFKALLEEGEQKCACCEMATPQALFWSVLKHCWKRVSKGVRAARWQRLKHCFVLFQSTAGRGCTKVCVLRNVLVCALFCFKALLEESEQRCVYCTLVIHPCT
jgi:hypothetical protein